MHRGNDSLNEAEGVGRRSLSCCVTEKYGRWSSGAWAVVGLAITPGTNLQVGSGGNGARCQRRGVGGRGISEAAQ
jgi:hypothetical protein